MSFFARDFVTLIFLFFFLFCAGKVNAFVNRLKINFYIIACVIVNSWKYKTRISYPSLLLTKLSHGCRVTHDSAVYS